MKTIKKKSSKSDEIRMKKSLLSTEDRIKVFANLIVDRLTKKFSPQLQVSNKIIHE